MFFTTSNITQSYGFKQFTRFGLGVSLTLNLCLLTVLFTPFTELLFKPLTVNERPYKSDAIVILSSGAYATGLPDFETLIRLRKGLELYREGWANKIICIGGIRYDKIQKSISDLMKETLILYGVPPNDILTQDETINTYNDVSYLLKKFEGEFNFDKTIFVTSSHHTYRVKQILRKKNVAARIVSAEPYHLMSRWFERMRLFREVIREYGAIVYFKLRGYI